MNKKILGLAILTGLIFPTQTYDGKIHSDLNENLEYTLKRTNELLKNTLIEEYRGIITKIEADLGKKFTNICQKKDGRVVIVFDNKIMYYFSKEKKIIYYVQ